MATFTFPLWDGEPGRLPGTWILPPIPGSPMCISQLDPRSRAIGNNGVVLYTKHTAPDDVKTLWTQFYTGTGPQPVFEYTIDFDDIRAPADNVLIQEGPKTDDERKTIYNQFK